jgi:hypothetical protein
MYKILSVLPALLVLTASLIAKPESHVERVMVDHLAVVNHKMIAQVSLPKSARDFIRQHFGKIQVKEVKAKKSPTPQGTFYEVTLMDNTELDFGKAGNWIEVKAEEPRRLPTSFFPVRIQTYLKNHYPGVGVESIDKGLTDYKLELLNDIKLYFDAKGVFLRKEK